LLDWPLVATVPDTLFVGLVVQHVVMLGIAAPWLSPSAEWDLSAGWATGREALNVAVLVTLFGLVHPLVAFSVYFGGWHAPSHILELLRFFRERGDAMSMSQFYREAFLFTALPFVGLAGLYAATQSFGLQNQMIALLFILIAIMTLPHMVVVEKMYWEREKRTPRAISS